MKKTLSLSITFSKSISSLTIRNQVFKLLLFYFLFFAGQTGFCQYAADLDPTFNLTDTSGSGAGAQGTVYSVALQSDGKLIVGGNFGFFNGKSCGGIVRLNVDGSIDSTFVTGIGIGASDTNAVTSILIQSNGKIILGGTFSGYNGVSKKNLVRLNSNGSIDNTFNGNGTNGYVSSIILQPDGNLLIVGSFTKYMDSYYGTDCDRIARLDPNGNFLTPFNSGGVEADNTIKSIALQSDNKILIGGTFSRYGDYYTGTNRSHIARLNSTGTLDLTFNPGTGANGEVQTIAVQSDGKILIAGDFTTFNGVSVNRIARLNSDGSLDTTFNTGLGANIIVYDLVLQADGKMLIGGQFNSINGESRKAISRLNSDGSIDNTFLSLGIVNYAHPNSIVFDIALQSDGNIFIVGMFVGCGDKYQSGIMHLHSNGALDTTFNPVMGVIGYIRKTVLQPDGKMIISGDFISYNGKLIEDFTRLNSDGSLDTTFTQVFKGIVIDVALQSDGKILVSGNLRDLNNDGILPYLIRLNSDGTIDTTFNYDGESILNSCPSKIVVQADGKIIFGGRAKVGRLNTDGSLDASFNIGTLSSNSDISSIVVQPDGKIFIGGGFITYNGISRKQIARLNTDGSLDTTFDIGTTIIGDSYPVIAIQSDGKILVGLSSTYGYIGYNSTMIYGIARFNTNGTFDTTFNQNNTITFSGHIYSIAIQPDGKIVIGGGFGTNGDYTSKNLARLNSDGTLDVNFEVGVGTNGYVYSVQVQSDGKIIIAGDFNSYKGLGRNSITRLNGGNVPLAPLLNPIPGPNGGVLAMATQSNDRILVGGNFTTFSNTAKKGIARLNSTYSLDAVFNTASGADNLISSVVAQPDNKILVGGSFTNYNDEVKNNITRLNEDGSLDPTFISGLGVDGNIKTIALQSDGKILIGGYFTNYNGTARNNITRLNADGTLDTTFNIGGTGASYNVYKIACQSDGKILIGGGFTTYNGIARNGIARLNTDGTLDTTFIPDLSLNIGSYGYVTSFMLQNDGKILVGGSFTTTSNGIVSNNITRLNSNGSLDATFINEVGANGGSVNAIVVQQDNKILIGGNFTSYNGIGQYRIARLNPDGTLDTSLSFGTGTNMEINSILLKANGNILIGGTFTTYNGAVANHIAEITIGTSALEVEEHLLQTIDVKIYPNPVTTTLNLAIPESMTVKSYMVYDMFGKQVVSETQTINTIDVSSLSKGLYVLKIQTNAGELTKKFIKE